MGWFLSQILLLWKGRVRDKLPFHRVTYTASVEYCRAAADGRHPVSLFALYYCEKARPLLSRNHPERNRNTGVLVNVPEQTRYEGYVFRSLLLGFPLKMFREWVKFHIESHT